ncbi:nitrilase family protein [Flavobacterium sp. JP2137]|uniref:nitrilase family protein n=1 Tax=Flavobacterium sp. JP2137 TaxID=3414510 RepID=UPI003D2FF97A
MKVALIQAPLVWEDPAANLRYFESKIQQLEPHTDLVVLPEMFSTGFTMNPERAFEVMDGATVLWMQDRCMQQNIALTGSIVIRENGLYYNRLFFVFPNGTYQTYDKRHLFSLAGEQKSYAAGTERLLVTYKDWKICPLVCYDLRFPVFARNSGTLYDLLIYVASWPDQRIYAWDSLLKARAIENMAYTIGVNRTGTDSGANQYSGHSQVLDYMGGYLVAPHSGEAVLYATLEKPILIQARKKLAFLSDGDSFTLLD